MLSNYRIKAITLSTSRLIIRELSYEDLNFVHLIHSIPEVQEYATLGIPESLLASIEYLKKYIEDQNNEPRKEYGFCVSLANGEPIGLVGLSSSLTKFNIAELWFKLHPKHWGKGYITEVVILF